MTLILDLLTVTLLMAALAAVGFYFTGDLNRLLIHYRENAPCTGEEGSAPFLYGEKNHENNSQQNQ